MKTQVMKVWDDGWRTAIVIQGRTTAHLIGAGTPIRVRRVPVEQLAQLEPLTLKGKPYPVERAIEHTLEAAQLHGITERARDLLERIRSKEITEAILKGLPEDDAAPPRRTSPDKAPRVGSSVLAAICDELKLDPRIARRQLRRAGQHSPYSDSEAIRAVLQPPVAPKALPTAARSRRTKS